MVKCPACSKIGYIEVMDNNINDSERGLLAVTVADQIICKHSFVAYIDRHFIMRDAFIADFKIKLPEIDIDELFELKKDDHLDKINLYLISLNIPALTLTYILHAFFNDKKVSLINDLDIINAHLMNFFNHIFQDSFKFEISIETHSSYRKNRKKYKDFIVIDKNNIMNKSNKNPMNLKQIKIEKAIIQRFLSEHDPKISLIIMKNEVQKAFKLSKELIQLNQSLKGNEQLTSRLMIDHFDKSYGVKIEKPYLDFLTEVAINYFKENFKQAKGSTDLVNYF